MPWLRRYAVGMDALLEAHRLMIDRYRSLIDDHGMPDRQRWLDYCDTALTISNTDKLSRWVGFIQGVLYAKGLITIEEERDHSRGIYKPVYDAMGVDSRTIDVKGPQC